VLSFGLALGVNRVMRPRVSYGLLAGDRTIATGSLWLDDGNGRVELKLVTIHVVASAIRRPFAPPIAVRELWIRSPDQDGQTAPDLELFADFSAPDRVIDAEARDANELTQRELPILAQALGSDARSRIRLPGSQQPALVSEGRLLIREALHTQTAASWRIQGDLKLSMHEGGSERSVSGTLNARLVWD
jgi:hypothetical protein